MSVSEAVAQYVLKERLVDPPQCSVPYQLTDAVNSQEGYMSQFGQDRWIDEVFQHQEGLFAVESGGYDGENYSNTLFLELHRSWQCLLVEPSPTMQEKLLAKCRKAHVFKGGLSICSGFSSFDFKLAGSNSSIASCYSEQHLEKVNGDLANSSWWMHEDQGEIVQVPCWPLHEIMQELGRSTIDYWSLDTEGSEPEILRHTRFDILEVGVLTVEHNLDIKKKAEIKDVLESAGFQMVKEAEIEDFYANPIYFEKRNLTFPLEMGKIMGA